MEKQVAAPGAKDSPKHEDNQMQVLKNLEEATRPRPESGRLHADEGPWANAEFYLDMTTQVCSASCDAEGTKICAGLPPEKASKCCKKPAEFKRDCTYDAEKERCKGDDCIHDIPNCDSCCDPPAGERGSACSPSDPPPNGLKDNF